MISSILIASLVSVVVPERPPQAPPIDPRFTLLVEPQPLPNVVGPPTVEFVGSQAPGRGVFIFADSECVSGNCPQGVKAKSKTVVKSEACESGSCGVESFEYRETVTRSEKPKRRGLFGGLFRGRRGRCASGSCQ